MRNRLLSFLAVAFVAMASFAQWTAPEKPQKARVDIATADPVSGETYYVMNVEGQQFLAGGKSWYSWATSAILADADNALQFTLQIETEAEDDRLATWYFARTTDSKHTFISGANPAGKMGAGEMHVDMGTQGHDFFEFLKQENGFYRIRIAQDDFSYGADVVEDWADRFWGWEGVGSDYPTAVYGTVKPEEGFACDWVFVPEITAQNKADLKAAEEAFEELVKVYLARLEIYNAAMDLKAAIDSAAVYNVDANDALAIYNDTTSTLDTLKYAKEAIEEAIRTIKVYAVLAVGDDGVNAPSDDNPCSAATSLILNAAFDEGTQWQQPPYWTVEAMGQNNCWQNNAVFQGEDGAFLDQFMESWINGTLKDGAMYQTMKSLPAGKYQFGCDAMTNGDKATVVGVELFATGGDITTTAPVATNASVPEHFTLTFVSAGGDMTLGLRTRSANVNWICADNFTLTYFGNNADPYQLALEEKIARYEEQYPEDEVIASKTVIEEFATTLEQAKSATEGFKEWMAIVDSAVVVLQNSINDYVRLNNLIEQWENKLDNVEGKWREAASEATDVLDIMRDGYSNKEYSLEDINDAENRISSVFAEAISRLVEKGDNLTFLLNNPGFDKDFSGWEKPEDWVTPAWGGLATGGEPISYVNEKEEEKTLESGNAEVYHAKFNIYQTIKNMPAGVFTLSCQAFERDDNGKGIDSELYAILGIDSTNIQFVKVKNLKDEKSSISLYNADLGIDGMDKNYDAQNDGGYIPNGMVGANIYFAEGYYKNYFNIELKEPTDITIGIRNLAGGDTWNSSGDWTLFDDFKIVYYGDGGDAYKDQIEYKKDGLIALLNGEDVITAEAYNNADKAVNDAVELLERIESATKDEALAIMAQLDSTTTEVKESAAKIKELITEVDVYNNYRIGYGYPTIDDEGISSSDEALMNLLDEIQPYVDGDQEFETNAQVEGYLMDLKKCFTVFVQCDHLDDATEAEPADITPVIYNYDGKGYGAKGKIAAGYYPGWDVTEGSVGIGNSGGDVAEFYNTNFNVEQTIYGLAPGYYRLGVQGFYRMGLADSLRVNLAEGVEEQVYAELYAGEACTKMLPITHDMAGFTEMCELEGITEGIKKIEKDSTTYNIPDAAAMAANTFSYEFEDEPNRKLYQNVLQFKVEEGQESVTIGIRKNELVTGDWCPFNNWTLLYLGKTEPNEDPTTAIAGIETVAPAKAVIYNLAGQRVQKAIRGLYIINGKKVVVK